MSNYNCLTMMILRKCRANYEELTSLINMFEENTWGDRYWGTVNGYGENHLGIILMDIRAKLQMSLYISLI